MRKEGVDRMTALVDHRRQIAESDIYALRRIVPKDRGKTWGDK